MANGREEGQDRCGSDPKPLPERHNRVSVVDGTEIAELVENEAAFGSYVEHKFRELDRDGDGKLSVKELEPAIADIGAAIGLPAQGSSPDSDTIYYEVIEKSFMPCYLHLYHPFTCSVHVTIVDRFGLVGSRDQQIRGTRLRKRTVQLN